MEILYILPDLPVCKLIHFYKPPPILLMVLLHDEDTESQFQRIYITMLQEVILPCTINIFIMVRLNLPVLGVSGFLLTRM